MKETEESFGTVDDPGAFRDGMIGRVAAWSIDNPGAPINYLMLFPELFEAMRHSFHEKQKATIRGIRDGIERYLMDGPETIAHRERERIAEILTNLEEQSGYCLEPAREILPHLFMARYND